MVAFAKGDVLSLSLDYDDVVLFNGDANAVLASVNGNKYFFVTGNQRLGAYKEVVTLTLTCLTSGSYTITNDAGVYGYVRAAVNEAGAVTNLVSDNGTLTGLSGGGGGGGGFTAVPHSTTLVFDGVNKEMPQTAITGPTAYTSSGSTAGTQINVCRVADGTNIPTFPTNFKEATGSSGFDNTANVKNYYQFIYTNNKVIYSVFQEVGDTGVVDATAPTLTSATVENAAPTTLTLVFSEALDQTKTLNIADFTLSGGKSDSAAVYGAGGNTVVLTVTAFTAGESITLNVAAGAVRDLAGNNLAAITARAITNNVFTVPSQVTGLTLGSTTSTTQALSWTAPSNGGSAITDYVIQYKLTSGSTWTTFSDGTSTTASTTVTGLTSATAYDFRVAAVNANGTGTYSTTVSATTSSGASAPAQVTGLTLGTPTSTTQPLSWSVPADGGSAITDYLIEYKATSSGTWLTFSDGVSTTASTTVTGLTASTSYDYRVSAINAIGTGTASATGTGSTAASGDTDANAFISAAGITDSTQQSAIQTLVTSLKANSLWTKLLAIYPMVGGTATTHKYNLKDPRDLDAAYRLSFNGTITHSASGITADGSTGWADTFFNASTNGSVLTDFHLSVYQNQASVSGVTRVKIGAGSTDSGGNNTMLVLGSSGAFEQGVIGKLFSEPNRSGGISPSSGHFVITTNGSRTANFYNNGVLSGTQYSSTGSFSNDTFALFALNAGGVRSSYENKRQAFATIGTGLSATDVSNLNSAIQAFNTTLSRNI